MPAHIRSTLPNLTTTADAILGEVAVSGRQIQSAPLLHSRISATATHPDGRGVLADVQRIEFTTDDLMRTSVVNAGLLPETLFALRVLQSRRAPAAFDTWRRRVRHSIGGPAQQIAGLFHPNGMLDLMTRLAPLSHRDDAAAAVAAVPAAALHRELAHLAQIAPLPSWAGDLARGARSARMRLAARVDDAFSGTISGLWPRMNPHLNADRLRYLEAMALGGVERLFSCLAPHVRWRAPVLEIIGAPAPGTARLRGADCGSRRRSSAIGRSSSGTWAGTIQRCCSSPPSAIRWRRGRCWPSLTLSTVYATCMPSWEDHVRRCWR
ncbi:hypothetical protein AB0B66_23630 [Catellatospora sp. NPDC049111]|uniref:hypothetical protein n=1 Tax=Catellatospora sp. NPDC049111 TaxID=3155271 RepID=UPI0033EABA1B